MNRFQTSFFSVLAVAFFLLLAGCSQTKDNLINRTCHNLSSHYNGYYNAGLKIEEGKDKLAQLHTDAYDRVLRVFPYASVEKSKQVYPEMDDAIKRLTTSISKHTMYDKRGNEKPLSEHWIDDNWLLYGQAQFFKHEYFQGLDAFRYVEATYKNESSRYLASLWIAKTYLELTQLNEAEGKLDYLRNVSEFPKRHRWELEATQADLYVQVKNYEQAIAHLQKAAKLAPKREDRIRFLFILAQLNQQLGNFPAAFQLYTKVIKMNPKYEMDFNCRINRARCFDATSGSGEEVKRELERLKKDPKNKDFLDQIYFALAGIAKKEGRPEEEIELLNLSIQSSTNNRNQKALSYLELAKIEFAKPQYKPAQLYYDSVIANLSNDYPDYSEILQRRNSLTKLVKYLNTIAKEDSLQKLAKMSPEDQAKAAADLLKKREEEALRKKKEQEQEQPANQIFNNDRQSQVNQFNQQSGSNWYFYNAQAVSFGFNEFTKRYGNRKLEDNWRRSNKESILPQPDGEESAQDTSKSGKQPEAKADPEAQKKELLKNIPSTPEALDKSTNKIIDAYYNAAMLYREQFNDINSSVKMFEEMIARFPKCKYEVQSYYQLYRMFDKAGNTARADEYKNRILNEYPTTDYAEILRNPDYINQLAGRKSEAEVFYEETYRKYLNGEYQTVMQRRTQALTRFPDNQYQPQFDLLRALCIGRTQPLPQFEASLLEVVRVYPEHPVKQQAQDILDYIKNNQGKTTEAPVTANPAADKRNYNYVPDTVHFVAIVFQSIGGALDGARFKTKLSDFNNTNYSSKGLTMQEFMLDHRFKILIVRSFENKQAAMSYHQHLFDNDDVYGSVGPENYKQFAISGNNLPELLRQKKTDEYEGFFRSFYQ
ncbi:MAG: tetratricopeptide repeat protein [Bacteroidota bacterium]